MAGSPMTARWSGPTSSSCSRSGQSPEPLPSSPGVWSRRILAARAIPAHTYRDLLDVPAEEEALLPRSFDIVGDIVLVRIPLH